MHELVSQFGIDWKLLLAQVVNFFILLYILKRFAYGPVMKMLAERKQNIEEGIRASNASQEKLAEAKEREKEILLQANEQALDVVKGAEDIAREHSKNILDSAQTKSEQVIARGQKKLEEERTLLVEEIKNNAERLIKASLIKIVGKLEPEERDQLLIQEALQELRVVSDIKTSTS